MAVSFANVAGQTTSERIVLFLGFYTPPGPGGEMPGATQRLTGEAWRRII